jgi:glycosyltransferase involved in cell wall biosynthesis
MKILELIPALGAGGGERFTVDLCNELAKDNDVYLLKMRFFSNSDFYLQDLSKRVHFINLKEGISLISKIKQIFIAFYWILRLKPDIVHGHLVAINWLLFASVFYHKPKYFFTIHNLAEEEYGTKLGYYVRKFGFKHGIHPVTISDTCETSFRNVYGFHSTKMIYNGCRNIKITNGFQEVSEEIDSYKNDKNTKVYINVARNAIQKNHELLIKSFLNFIRGGANAILILIGDWNQNIERKKELLSMITSPNIHFLGPKNNVSDYLVCADYFCLSSSWEGLPISVLEAGLLGCYPVLTSVGGNKDIIIDDNWGLLSSECTTKAYIEVLKESYHKNIDREKIKSLYLSKFTMNKCSKSYLNLFKNIKYNE